MKKRHGEEETTESIKGLAGYDIQAVHCRVIAYHVLMKAVAVGHTDHLREPSRANIQVKDLVPNHKINI